MLDLGLPDGDGLELVRDVRAQRSTPVIVVSARHQEAQKIRLLDAGADDYLTKPFSVAELLARIRVALRHRGTALAAAVTRARSWTTCTSTWRRTGCSATASRAPDADRVQAAGAPGAQRRAGW